MYEVYVAIFKSVFHLSSTSSFVGVPPDLRSDSPGVGISRLDDVVLELSVSGQVAVMGVVDLLSITEDSGDVELVQMSEVVSPGFVVLNTIAVGVLLSVVACEPSLASLGAGDHSGHEVLLLSVLLGIELDQLQVLGRLNVLDVSGKLELLAHLEKVVLVDGDVLGNLLLLELRDFFDGSLLVIVRLVLGLRVGSDRMASSGERVVLFLGLGEELRSLLTGKITISSVMELTGDVATEDFVVDSLSKVLIVELLHLDGQDSSNS